MTDDFAANSLAALRDRNLQLAMYATAGAICVVGISYAAVPLYQIFCQATGYGGTTQQASEEKFKNMKPVPGARQLTVNFNADTSSSMPWTFVPQQRVVKVVPGETALAFYTAHNPTDAPVTGVSTYNVTPMRAGLYFNKIQCFCFEEQRLRPHEEIDMPVRARLRSCVADRCCWGPRPLLPQTCNGSSAGVHRTHPHASATVSKRGR